MICCQVIHWDHMSTGMGETKIPTGLYENVCFGYIVLFEYAEGNLPNCLVKKWTPCLQPGNRTWAQPACAWASLLITACPGGGKNHKQKLRVAGLCGPVHRWIYCKKMKVFQAAGGKKHTNVARYQCTSLNAACLIISEACAVISRYHRMELQP